MNKYLKYLKGLILVLGVLFSSTLIISILYYLNILNDGFNNYLLLLSSFISMLVGGIYIGLRSKEKGYVEGIKIGLISIFILMILSIIIYKTNINSKNIIYYLILLSSSILGSMIGINKKKTD